ASRTEDALRTIDKVLHEQWNKVVEEAKKEEPSEAVAALAKNAGGQENPARAKLLWVKFRLVEAFPESFAEIKNAPIYANNYIPLDKGRYVRQYNNAIIKAKGTKAATESAACLFLALTVNRGGVRLDESHLSSNIADTDGDGVRELVDGWGNPVRFQ